MEELCQEWQRGLGSAPGSPLSGIFLSQVDSTQRLARTLLDQCVHEDEGPLPFVVAALEQSAGRGREGRGWWSPAGSGLYASLVIPVSSNQRLQELPIRVAAALASFVSVVVRGDCRIKWPNDLLLQGKKIKPEMEEYFDKNGKLSYKELREAEEFDGYSVIFTTVKLSKKEIVEIYFDKDLVEKAFQSLKGIVKVQPVRHWLYNRVIVHVFICYLAYLLLSLHCCPDV